MLLNLVCAIKLELSLHLTESTLEEKITRPNKFSCHRGRFEVLLIIQEQNYGKTRPSILVLVSLSR